MNNIINKHPAHFMGDSYTDRPKGDLYPTHPKYVLPLFEKEEFPKVIWEPSCGDGTISNIFWENGYEVFSSDLYDWGYKKYFEQKNFYEYKNAPATCIVTNPPYKTPEGTLLSWIKHCLSFSYVQKVYLLSRTLTIHGVNRAKFISKSPLKNIYTFDRRLKFYKYGNPYYELEKYGKKTDNNMIDYSWFVWDKGYMGKPQQDYIFLDPIKKEEFNLWTHLERYY